jgi:hypothetical protein
MVGTVARVFYRDEAHPLAPKLAPDGDGLIWMPQEGFKNALAQHASTASAAMTTADVHPATGAHTRPRADAGSSSR